MKDFRLKSAEAFAHRNPQGRWLLARDRLQPDCAPVVQPKFTIPERAQIYTIGSCFARNIETYLAVLGYDIPTLSYVGQGREYGSRDNGILNRYSPAAIWQDLDWFRTVRDTGGTVDLANSGHLGLETPEGWIDLHIGGMVPVTQSRFVERRQQIYDIIRATSTADCVTITLGLIEVWFDRESGLYIHAAPASRGLMEHGDRFEFHVLSYASCYKYILDTVEFLKENGCCNVLLTTSPVPLAQTFTDLDVIVANMQSKSLLRAVCGEIAQGVDIVDYFPAYEMVQGTRDWRVFEDDLIHVSRSYIAKVVKALGASHLNFSGAQQNMLNAFVLGLDEHWAQALEALQQAQVPDNDLARCIAAAIHANCSDPAAARAYLTDIDAHGLHPVFWQFYLDAASLCQAPETYLKTGRELAEHMRANLPVKIKYGIALDRAGSHTQAKDYLTALAKAHPKAPRVFMALAGMCQAAGDDTGRDYWNQQAKSIFSGGL